MAPFPTNSLPEFRGPMRVRSSFPFVLLCFFATPLAAFAEALPLTPAAVQGGLSFVQTRPGATATLDGAALPVTEDGEILIGFGRDHPADSELVVVLADGTRQTQRIAVAERAFDIQRIDGLPNNMVSPPESVLNRIRGDSKRVRAARAKAPRETLYRSGFIWPSRGVITGVYGSQRVLNGQERQPHWGIDIAAPAGTAVLSPADGIVTLVEPDLYFSGATLMIAHGYGLASTFLHLDTIDVALGQRVRQGERIATVGSSGRSTGPHLDWRVNLGTVRIDAALLVPPMPAAAN